MSRIWFSLTPGCHFNYVHIRSNISFFPTDTTREIRDADFLKDSKENQWHLLTRHRSTAGAVNGKFQTMEENCWGKRVQTATENLHTCSVLVWFWPPHIYITTTPSRIIVITRKIMLSFASFDICQSRFLCDQLLIASSTWKKKKRKKQSTTAIIPLK